MTRNKLFSLTAVFCLGSSLAAWGSCGPVSGGVTINSPSCTNNVCVGGSVESAPTPYCEGTQQVSCGTATVTYDTVSYPANTACSTTNPCPAGTPATPSGYGGQLGGGPCE